MSAPINPVQLPCPCCQGRRYLMVPTWQGDHSRFANAAAPITIAGVTAGSGFLATQERVSVPLTLRVCVQCGAAQAFADPAAVQALTQLQPPVAFYVDASDQGGGFR